MISTVPLLILVGILRTCGRGRSEILTVLGNGTEENEVKSGDENLEEGSL